MKLASLAVNNYRSLGNIRLPLRDLITIIGPNGSGKTSLLDVFRMLQQGCQQELSSFLETQGGFSAILSQTSHEKATRLRIELEIDAQNPRSLDLMHYELQIAPERVGYSIAFESLEWKFNPRAKEPFHYVSSRQGQLTYFDPDTQKLVEPTWSYDPLELALAQVPRMYHEPETLRAQLAGIRHYSFLDVSPRAVVRLPQSLTPTTRPGPNGENLYSALYNLRASHSEVYERIETLLEQGFPGFKKLEFPVVGSGQVTMTWHDRSGKAPYYPNQLSEGTLRFLWLITILLSPHPVPLLLLDEPEVSLHPELLKLLAALLQDTSASSQIIVATHSPDLIRWLHPKEVLIADKEDGQTRFTWADELNLEEWLEEYTLSELWAMGNLGGRP